MGFQYWGGGDCVHFPGLLPKPLRPGYLGPGVTDQRLKSQGVGALKAFGLKGAMSAGCVERLGIRIW